MEIRLNQYDLNDKAIGVFYEMKSYQNRNEITYIKWTKCLIEIIDENNYNEIMKEDEIECDR